MQVYDIEQLVGAMLRDIDDVTDPLQDYNAIELAVMRLSLDKPCSAVEDLTLAGTRLVDLPTNWVSDFSYVTRFEYPVDANPRAYLDDVTVYQSPAGKKLDVCDTLTGTCRVTFTVPYILSEDAALSTVPEKYKEPLASYVVHLLLNQMAANYSHDQSNFIQADTVDQGDKSRKFSALAKVYLKKYEDQVGIEKPKESGAGSVANWDRQRLGLLRRRVR